MTTKPDYIRQSLHADDLDDNGHHAGGVGYAECNTPPTTSTAIDFDTFYDVDAAAGPLPPSLGLSYLAGGFIADADGIWIVYFGASLVAAPGVTGDLTLHIPGYGYNPTRPSTASGNAAEWQVERIIPMRTGQDFSVTQTTSGGVALFTYAVLDIIRIARSVS